MFKEEELKGVLTTPRLKRPISVTQILFQINTIRTEFWISSVSDRYVGVVYSVNEPGHRKQGSPRYRNRENIHRNLSPYCFYRYYFPLQIFRERDTVRSISFLKHT